MFRSEREDFYENLVNLSESRAKHPPVASLRRVRRFPSNINKIRYYET